MLKRLENRHKPVTVSTRAGHAMCLEAVRADSERRYAMSRYPSRYEKHRVASFLHRLPSRATHAPGARSPTRLLLHGVMRTKAVTLRHARRTSTVSTLYRLSSYALEQ